MVRSVNYDSRRKAILASVIKRYIRDANPVSSEEICREFDLSSATIRNIFAELEQDGYLTHPYTSGGRIPTNKGYRYYVDFLLSQMELLDEKKQHIIGKYQERMNRLEDALEITSEVISNITHYASIVSFLEWQDKMFYKGISFILEQPEFRDIQKLRIILKMIEDKQQLLQIINRDFPERVKVYIGDELDCPQISNCSIVVSNYCINDKPLGKIAVFGPNRMDYHNIIPALEYVSDALVDVLGDKV